MCSTVQLIIFFIADEWNQHWNGKNHRSYCNNLKTSIKKGHLENWAYYVTFLFVITLFFLSIIYCTMTERQGQRTNTRRYAEIDWTSYNVTVAINVEQGIINVCISIYFVRNLQLFHLLGCQRGDDGCSYKWWIPYCCGLNHTPRQGPSVGGKLTNSGEAWQGVKVRGSCNDIWRQR